MNSCIRRAMLLTLCLASFALADITNWHSGETIPGTELITPEPLVVLEDWNTEARNLRFADLARLNLEGASFANSWLDDARFDRSNLRQANLTNASLVRASLNTVTQYNADFTSANLAGADLSYSFSDRVNLSSANLTGADLTKGRFGLAILTAADLTDALISGVDFQQVTGLTSNQLYSTESYKQKSLPGVYLGRNDLEQWDFGGQDLTGASFFRAEMTQANLSLANLTDANFQGATLTGADFSGANITAASFSVAFEANGIGLEQLYSTSNYWARNLSSIGLSGSDLTSANFSGFDLQGARLSGTVLRDADLSGADLTDAWLASSTLANASLQDALIARANFSDTTAHGLTQAQLTSTLDYQNGDLSGLDLSSNNLDGWDFHEKQLVATNFWVSSLIGADLSGANLQNANLGVSNLTGADLSRADLTRAQLWTATLAGADLTDALITNASLGRTTRRGFTAEQLYSTANYGNRNLTNLRLEDNDLSGWNFREQDLTNADFGAVNETSILADADFERANLSRANFSGANLLGANLKDANISKAYFSNVMITADQLYETANYQNGDLQGIRSPRNDLSGWDFAEIDLTDSSFDQSDLSSADLSGATLAHASLQFGKLNGAVLVAADLTSASLQYAKLIDANLSDVQLGNANLTSADLTGSNLANADLTGADLRLSVGFSPLASTVTRNVIWPDGRIRGLEIRAGETYTFPHSETWSDSFTVDVQDRLEISDDATLGLRIGTLDADDSLPVHSHLVIAADATVNLGGTLRITEFGHWLTGPMDRRSWSLFAWPQPLDPGNVFSAFELPAGAWDTSQLYTTGTIILAAKYQEDGDFDVDGQLTSSDIDRLSLSLRGGRDTSYDVTGDGLLDEQDHWAWVGEFVGTVPGDADLNRAVEFADFLRLSDRFGEAGGWANGDFDGDGQILFADFLLLSRNFGWQATTPASTVPEPSTCVLVLLTGLVAFRWRACLRLRSG